MQSEVMLDAGCWIPDKEKTFLPMPWFGPTSSIQ
jgi:hypothetical protein